MAILAFVYDEGPCPWELAEALWCEEYHLAPRSGGLERQDAAQLMLYGSIKALYYALLKQQQCREQLTAAERDLVGEVMELDLEAQISSGKE